MTTMNTEPGEREEAPERIQRTVKVLKRRRVWKTFYFESGRDYHEIESVWQSWSRSKPTHRMIFEGGGLIQTNVPIVELRDIFRTADAKWVDYVSDTERT